MLGFTTFSGSPNDGDTSLTFSVSAANGTAVRIIADVEVDGGDKVQKEKIRQNNEVASGVTASSDGSYSLGKADIIRIVSITDSTGTNVTERFTLDNGQRDNFYDIGRVWTDGENSKILHNGYGGGIWFNIFGEVVISAYYGTSGSENSFEVKAGFFF